jgi:hypothetical protein
LFPSLAGLYKKYEKDGLHIIGFECQGSSATAIGDYAKAAGATFQLAIKGGLRGAKISGIPQGFLFGPDGQLVSNDVFLSTNGQFAFSPLNDPSHGTLLEPKLKALFQEITSMPIGPGPYTKLAQLVAQVKANKDLGTVLSTLRAKQDSADADEAKEAKMMFAALNGAAQKELDQALKIKAYNSANALRILDKLAAQFAGDAIGEKAKAEADAIKQKQAAQPNEPQAHRMLQQAKNYQANGMPDQAKNLFTEIVAKYGETDSAKEAKAKLEELNNK